MKTLLLTLSLILLATINCLSGIGMTYQEMIYYYDIPSNQTTYDGGTEFIYGNIHLFLDHYSNRIERQKVQMTTARAYSLQELVDANYDKINGWYYYQQHGNSGDSIFTRFILAENTAYNEMVFDREYVVEQEKTMWQKLRWVVYALIIIFLIPIFYFAIQYLRLTWEITKDLKKL